MDKHITILGVCYIALGLLGIFLAVIFFVILGGVGVASGDRDAVAVLGGIGGLIAVIAIILSLPSIIGGIGLLKRASWSRILVLILGVISLFNVPIGTILGVYTIWVLMNDETAAILSGRPQSGTTPPPPSM